MKGFNVKITKCIPIFIFRDAQSAIVFSFSTAQFNYSTAQFSKVSVVSVCGAHRILKYNPQNHIFNWFVF